MHLPDYLSHIYAPSPLFKERGKSEVSHFMKQLKATATVKPFQIDTSTVQEDREELLIRVAKGEHMPDYQNHNSYLFSSS